MLEQLGIHYEPNILTVIGVLIAVSFLGSKLFQRVGIPQVVGFIVIGVVLRSLGKFMGARLGGTLGRAEPVVRDNLGLGLLSQAG